MHIAVGGTFDRLHKGHELLLEAAFTLGSFVHIGIASEELIRKSRKEFKNKIRSVNERKESVKQFIKHRNFEKPYRIQTLTHPFGITHTDSNMEAIVVSEETLPAVFEINEIRVQSQFKPLIIIIIPEVEDEAGIRITSTRKRELDVKED